MNEIRAFVGHSFTEDDAGIVGIFLKYLDQLAQAHPSFSWEHAEGAEPKELADKVLRLIEDKNVFIWYLHEKGASYIRGCIEKHAISAWFIEGCSYGIRMEDI